MVSPDRNRRVEEAGENRRLLIYHPAGVFFALAAAIAVTLPWLWFLPLEDPWLAHVRLGLFGFGGIAISGYIMTAQKAWTGRAFPVPALLAGGLALGGRLASLGFPAHLWPIILFSLPVAIMVAWPVLRARCWDKLPLATVPLVLVAAEILLPDLPELAGFLPVALAVLILAVGGRLVRSFVMEGHRRRGLDVRQGPPLWQGIVPLVVGLLCDDVIGMLALFAAMAWVAARSLEGMRLGGANRMLCLGYAGLVPGILAIAAARAGLVPQLVQVHALTMATMGPMILAIAARATMRRSPEGELLPRRRHWSAFWLMLGAAALRCLAALSGQMPMALLPAGIAWSAAWMLFLSVQIQALAMQAPFPLLSARRLS